MQIIKRFILAATAAVISLTIIIILVRSTPKPTISWRAAPATRGGYPYTKPNPLPWNPPHPRAVSSWKPDSQLIVKVQLPDEDISWLSSLAPTWTNTLIPIDDRFTRLHAGADRVEKGRIATAYLTWIIENYNNLPTNIVFLAPTQHPQQEETRKEPPSAPRHAKIQQDITALRLPFLQSTGFAPLPCPPPAACAHPLTPFRKAPHELRTLEVSMVSAWRSLFNNTHVPVSLAAAPGAQFAVSRAQVLARGVGEYERYWAWLQRTKMDDESAGLVMEVLWHAIFGRGEVFCPEFGTCECEVYGRC